MEPLKDQQTSIDQLVVAATVHPMPIRMTDWVDSIFEAPSRPMVKYATARNRSMKNGKIGYYEIRAIAQQWDREGISRAIDFVRAVECETEGTERYRIVQDAINNFDPVQIEVCEEVVGDWWDL